MYSKTVFREFNRRGLVGVRVIRRHLKIEMYRIMMDMIGLPRNMIVSMQVYLQALRQKHQNRQQENANFPRWFQG